MKSPGSPAREIRHEALGYAQCRREFPTLLNVAQKRFGSWVERYGKPD